jgi:pimeloyl-ACP methyl ester carboxylesterase
MTRFPRFLLSTAVLAPTILLASSQVPSRTPATVPPCVAATTACTEWVTIGGGPARSMFYRTYSLDVPNTRVTRALIMVHGTNRNADHYFDTAKAAAFLAGALEDTVVIAPHMIDRTDKAAPNEVVWQSSWRTGGPSVADPSETSFDFVDEILRKLAKKSTFPNLKAIVVAGHSAGGQFVNRYSMSNKIHDTLGVPVTYVVANPSSYAWPDATRPLAQDDADPIKAKDGWNLDVSAAVLPPHTQFTFGPFDATKAPSYNTWPAGLEKRDDPRNGAYIAKMTDDQLRKQLVERPITFILGQVDTLPLGGFDSSPTAMAQGPTRRARGEAFVKYVNEKLGAKHPIMIVPECGHNDRCMYTTDIVFPVIFPKN